LRELSQSVLQLRHLDSDSCTVFVLGCLCRSGHISKGAMCKMISPIPFRHPTGIP
jgi:hypothetical protein